MLTTNSLGGLRTVDSFVLGVECSPGRFPAIKDCPRNSLPFLLNATSVTLLFLHQVLDGYFVHYFAPKNLPPLPKNVVFVLDISASMVGAKLQQVSQLPAQ